jgi:steroid 5-alpha reductase family enzyme
MLDWGAYGYSFAAILIVAIAFWLVSLIRNDVSIVDSLWSMMFLMMLGLYMSMVDVVGPRSWLVMLMVAVWAIRLSAFIAIRNHGEPEDHRYQAIRKNNQPNFRFKSLFIVFGLQASLAGFIGLPLLFAASGTTPLRWLDYAGVTLWFVGMFFEVVGDHQLKTFRADPNNRGQVLNTGLWRLTRHPNYFGEFTLWWGYFCLALAAGGWWTVISPLLMSVLLLKVSGVSLLESTIKERRPAYADYVKHTNAFFPGLPGSRPSLH